MIALFVLFVPFCYCTRVCSCERVTVCACMYASVWARFSHVLYSSCFYPFFFLKFCLFISLSLPRSLPASYSYYKFMCTHARSVLCVDPCVLHSCAHVLMCSCVHVNVCVCSRVSLLRIIWSCAWMPECACYISVRGEHLNTDFVPSFASAILCVFFLMHIETWDISMHCAPWWG